MEESKNGELIELQAKEVINKFQVRLKWKDTSNRIKGSIQECCP